MTTETEPTDQAEPTEPDANAEATQYGLRYPNGTIDWADDAGDVQLWGEVGQQFSLVDPGPLLSAFLAQRATQARMDPAVYIKMHHIVARTITTSVSRPAEYAELPAPELGSL